jgi:O-antigen/teichoic acid export membrane protein
VLSRLKFTARSTLIYSLGSISLKLIGLILLPIYTDQLTTDQFGMWSLLEVTSQILVITFGLRLSTAMLRFYSDEKGGSGRSKIVFTALLASLVSIFIFNAGTHPFVQSFSQLFFDTPKFADYFTFLIIWISFEILNRLVLDLVRIKERPGFYITLTIIKFVIVLSLNIYFIVYRGMGIKGIILGQLLGSIFIFLFALPFLLREITWSVDRALFQEMFKYGFPLIFSGISTFALNAGDRYLLKIFMDYHEVGIYSLSYKISNVLKMVLVQAFQLGFLPIAFNMYNKPDAPRFFSKIFTYYTFILFWSGLVIALFSKELIVLLASSETYYESYQYIPWLVLSVCFFGMQNFFIIGLHYAKKTKRIAVITLIVLGFSMGLNLLLIPWIGLYGAAITSILSGLLMTLLNFFQSQKYYPIRYELKKVGIIVAVSILLVVASLLFSNWHIALRMVVKALLILVFPAALYLVGFYEAVEIERLKGLWNKWKNPRHWYDNLAEISRKQSMDSSDI